MTPPRPARRAPLVAAAVLVAVSIAGVGSAQARTAARGTVVVRLSAPRGVAVDASLRATGTGTAHIRVLTKGPGRAQRRIVARLPAGRVVVRASTVVARGRLYAPRAHRRTLRLRAGRRASVAISYRSVSVASGLTTGAIHRRSVTLSWTARRHAVVRLRRAVGAVAPTRVRSGHGVRIGRPDHATDRHLAAGTEYSYALFTRRGRRWAPPVTISVGTASRGGATYVAPPSTTIVRVGDPFTVAATRRSISVALPAGEPTPVLGAGFVLPVSRALPGGFLGKVAAVSADGRTVRLVQGALTDAFTRYHIDVAFTRATRPLSRRPSSRQVAPGPAAFPHGSEQCKETGAKGGMAVDLNPTLSVSGSFSATVLTHKVVFLPVPTGTRFALDFRPTFTVTPEVTASVEATCEYFAKRWVKLIAADPVPISVAFDPEIVATVGGETSLGGVTARGALDTNVEATVRPGKIDTRSSTTHSFNLLGEPEVKLSTPVEAALRGRLTMGPGGGVPEAGAIAGLSGALDPIKATITPSIDSDGHDVCLSAGFGGDFSLGLHAEVWAPHFTREATANFKTVDWTYGPQAHFGSGCETEPPVPATDLLTTWTFPDTDDVNGSGDTIPPALAFSQLPDGTVQALSTAPSGCLQGGAHVDVGLVRQSDGEWFGTTPWTSPADCSSLPSSPSAVRIMTEPDGSLYLIQCSGQPGTTDQPQIDANGDHSTDAACWVSADNPAPAPGIRGVPRRSSAAVRRASAGPAVPFSGRHRATRRIA